MTERPILFSGPMVRAILDGSKTQTRRVLLPQPMPSAPSQISCHALDDGGVGFFDEERDYKSPYGQPSGRLWVRETWAPVNEMIDDPSDGAIYRADYSGRIQPTRWRPSIHMPRWANRITLEVTAVRVERLQDISVEDAIAEGVTYTTMQCPRAKFVQLWEGINGKRGYGWDSNPWVWVVEFRRVSEDQSGADGT